MKSRSMFHLVALFVMLLSLVANAILLQPVLALASNTGQWVWVDGSNTAGQSGIYGTEDIPAANNVPGSRESSSSWIDDNGNLWLFGGIGLDSVGNSGFLNDLWKFNPSTGQWAWVDGSNTINQNGIHGIEDTPTANNVPGARSNSVSWIDGSGNLWLFGGSGYDGNGYNGYLNDLWKFDPNTEQWTWVDGANTRNQSGTYGTEDIPATNNVPGARFAPVSWMDGSGNFWLFGGFGIDSTGRNSLLNDLWKFDPNTGQWTWVDGANITIGDEHGIYGTEGVPGVNNIPGARMYSISWMDKSGNLWLFGGSGYESTNKISSLNDLWMFNPNTGQWTWVDGANTVNQSGIYGTEDIPATNNVPGARYGSSSWVDGNGSLWLFGGFGYDSLGVSSTLNDLWKFEPNTGHWTWVDGANTAANSSGTYGTEDIPAASNVPGGRGYSVSWIDEDGDLWLFGGSSVIHMNDLWKFATYIYTATFNVNGGSGSMNNQVASSPTALTTNAFTRTGYTFSGWNTAADGSGTAYADGATYDFSADVTLYAQWAAVNHTVTFNANSGTGSMSPQVNNLPAALTANAFTRTDYSFSGWNTAANGSGTAYANGAVYDFSSDVTLYAQWTVLTPTFADVPLDYWSWKYIESIYDAGITGGCSTNPLNYCPTSSVTRAQMAVFLLKGIHGSSFTPPAVNGSTGFNDVATDYWAAAWIKQLAAEGITGGCGNSNYCPENTVTRDQMAVFLLKAKYGSSYAPPAITDTGFTDVPTDYWAAAWIKQLAAEAITGGCGGGLYCPSNPVTRDQMAVFLQRTFNLPLP